MKYNLKFNYNGREYEALIVVDYNLQDDGIGAYEFWGAKYFDKNNWVIGIEGYKLLGIYLEGELVNFEVDSSVKKKMLACIDKMFYSDTQYEKMVDKIKDD